MKTYMPMNQRTMRVETESCELRMSMIQKMMLNKNSESLVFTWNLI